MKAQYSHSISSPKELNVMTTALRSFAGQDFDGIVTG